MCQQEAFLQYANHCQELLRLLEERSIPTHYERLQKMADAWLRLAAEEQRIADLVREADALFSVSNSDERIARSRNIRARLQ